MGWSGWDDITSGQRREVRRIITECLVDDAQRKFLPDMLGRPSALALLKELAAKVAAGTDD